MALKTQTLDELHATALGALRAYIDDADTAPGSDYDTTARMVAAVALMNQMQAEQLAEEIFPESSSDEFAVRHAKSKGLVQQLATASIGKVQITAASGTEVQAEGSELTHVDGSAFATTEPGTMALPAWTGKTCAGDCDVARLIVSPNTTGMAADDIVTVSGAARAIKAVISSISAIDFYEPLPAAPAAGVAISATRGIVVAYAADEVGASGNKAVGDELTISSPATGVNAAARIIESGGGGDDETIAELRARVVDVDTGRPGGGNVEHIRELARTTPGVRLADAVVFPCFRGLGTVDVIPIGVSGARVVGSEVAALVLAHLRSNLSYAADLDVFEMPLTVGEYDSDVTIACEQGYERDFVGGPFAVAAAPASTTTRIYLTATPVGVIEVGDRVLAQVKTSVFWKTYQRTVTSVQASGGNQWIEIDEPLPVAPTSADPNVHSGGPLAAEAIAALEALYDGLGPSRRNVSPSYTYERHPLPSLAWDDTLRRASMTEALMGLDGVANVTITTPSSDQQPGAQETIRRGKITLRFTEA